VTLKMFSLTCLERHNFSTHNVPSNTENKKLKPEINSPWCFYCHDSCFGVRPTYDLGDVLLPIQYGSTLKSRRKIHWDELFVQFMLQIQHRMFSLWVIYFGRAVVIWADRNGRNYWTRNSNWPSFPSLFTHIINI